MNRIQSKDGVHIVSERRWCAGAVAWNGVGDVCIRQREEISQQPHQTLDGVLHTLDPMCWGWATPVWTLDLPSPGCGRTNFASMRPYSRHLSTPASNQREKMKSTQTSGPTSVVMSRCREAVVCCPSRAHHYVDTRQKRRRVTGGQISLLETGFAALRFN